MRSLCFLLMSLAVLPALAEEPQATFFETKIRPLLAEACYKCHAADTKQKAGLLLDSKAGWQIGGDSGPALVPGDPEASLMIRAIGYEETDLQMPPKKRLTGAQIADLTQWVADGAYDPREGGREAVAKAADSIDVAARKSAHWAWQKVTLPTKPVVKQTDWPQQSIDPFILAKLEEAELTPNGAAASQVLIRRVFFDLTGLPPTPEQVKAFMAEPTEGAYEAVVDDLLKSQHFGEHWGQHWLDLVRFAETWGHEQDFAIPHAWRYRDYVIRAFNADVPYDDFLVEHVAGDLVEKPRIDAKSRANESIQGTGFWHLGEATHSPVDIREDECVRLSNQIDVFSKAFLGQTVMCARCHDHKFEAITTKDYYRLFGYLQSSNYQIADVSDPEAQAEAATTLADIQKREDQALRQAMSREYFLKRADGDIDWSAYVTEEAKALGHPLYPLTEKETAQALERWLDEEKRSQAELAKQTVIGTERKGELDLIPIERIFDESKDVIADYSMKDVGWYVSGHRFGKNPVATGTVLPSGLALEVAAHSDLLSEKFTGLIRTKTFEVTGDRLWFRYRGQAKMFLAVDSHRVCQGPLHSGRLRKNLESKEPGYHWVSHDVSKYIGHRVRVEFTPKSNFSLSRVQFSHDKPKTPFVANAHLKAALTDSGNLNAAYNRLFDRSVDAWNSGSADRHQLALVDWLFFRSKLIDVAASPRVEAVRERFSRARAEAEGRIPKPIQALALMDGSAEDEPVHFRGNYRTLSPEPVRRGHLLDALASGEETLPPDGSGRLQLAHQIISADNPLTARVFVNRVWHHLFGRGIVETVDNLGSAGTKPSHPELLDHLAYRFVHEQGWSTKRLLRELVLSQTYRMSSEPHAEKTAVDPTNLLVHRMPIRRLTGEAIRDHLLHVSGRLDRKPFGESVMVHISDFMRSNRSPAGSGPLDGNGRRSIYIEGRRNHMEPLLVAFDKPTPFTAIGKRNVSSSPAQPLMMLNNELVHQEAARWAKQLLEDDALSEPQRVDNAYWQAFGRAPESWEKEAAVAFLAEQRKLHSGDALAAWKDLAHTLVNVKEFIFIN